MPGIAYRDPDLCTFCGICRNNVTCPAGEALGENCIGCGACVLACPGGAIKIAEDHCCERRDGR